MKKLLFAGLGFIFFTNSFAQTDSTIQQNNQPRVVVFNSPSSVAKKKKKASELNVVKLNVFSIFAGDIAMHYERKLADKISVEAGTGVTLRDFLAAAVSADDYNDINQGSSQDYRRDYLLGYSFNVGLRVYPSGAMEEFYFMPDFRFRKYNSEYIPDGAVTGVKEFVKMSDYKMNIGYVNYIDDNIILDYYVGIGIRKKVSSVYGTTEKYDPNLGYYTEEGLIYKDRFVPAITLGLKFGFVF